MATERDYMPTPNSEFLLFEGDVVDKIVPNAVAYNIPATQVTLLQSWSAGYAPLFNAISIKKNRTTQQIVAHDVYRKDYEAFLRQFIQGFVVNNVLIPMDVRVGMGLRPRGYNPRSKRPKITTFPSALVLAMGGGLIRFEFRVVGTGGRAHRHPYSDGVEIYFQITTSIQPPPVAPVTVEAEEAEEILGTNQTESDYDTHFSTRAMFTKQLSVGDKGKYLHLYARWVNNVNPTLSGPFSPVTTTVIS